MRSFSFLNVTQFLDALNENLFKLIVVFFLIYYQGEENTSKITAITGAIFILPFILFSNVGGIFADCLSKTSMIRITRIIQLAILCFAWISVVIVFPNLVYLCLFLFATLSAIFSPSKYGIIPELVDKKRLLFANSIIAAFTYFGIILGTALASLLDTVMHQLFPLMILACFVLTAVGTYFSFLIHTCPAANPKKKMSFFIYKEIYTSLVQMDKIPLLLVATFAYSYFLFIGAFAQMNIIPYSVQILKMGPVMGGYLFAFSAIGVGFGALLASKMSGNLSILSKAGFGMSAACFLLTLFPTPFWLCIIWLILLGFFGGIFLVPPQAFILKKSHPQNRGRNFATANFFSFVAAFLAAGSLYLLNTLLALNPLQSFAVIGGVNLLVSFGLYLRTK